MLIGDEDGRCVDAAIFMKRNIPACGLAVFPQSGHTICQRRTLSGVGRQPSVKLGPTHRVFAQELHPLRPPGVPAAIMESLSACHYASNRSRSLGSEPAPAEATISARHRVGDGKPDGHRAAHGQSTNIGLIDAQMLQQPVKVFDLMVLRVSFWVVGHAAGRITTVAVGDDLVAPGEEIHLRLPTSDVSGEFVAPDQGVSLAGHLVVDIYSIR